MPAIKSRDEFKHTVEAAQQRFQEKTSRNVQVLVGMSSCGIAVRAGDTLKSILNILEKEKIGGITVTQTGCLGLCEHEPIVQVIIANQPRVIYGNVNGQVAEKIIKQHVRNGKLVQENIIENQT
jgi:NADP-reducing hydrogenase subunit HndB